MVWERRIHYPLSIKHTDYINGNPIGCVSHFRQSSIYTCRTRTIRASTNTVHNLFVCFTLLPTRTMYGQLENMSVTITTALRFNFFVLGIKGGMMLVRLISI